MTQLERLYERVGRRDVCRICGKAIYAFGKGSHGVMSHARKHVHEGKAVIQWVASPRCYQCRDPVYLVKPGVELMDPVEFNLVKIATLDCQEAF